MIRTCFLSILVLATLSAAEKPDIVLILVDDMGFSDIGCYGGEIPTPHIDALAERGVRFNQFYNAARCSPTRATIMTGLHPHQADHAGNQGIIPADTVTLPECLKTVGYQTYMTGKWHLNSVMRESDGKRELAFDEDSNPCARGFDRYYGALEGANAYDRQALGKIYEGNDVLTELAADWYCTTAFTDRAIDYIDEGDPEQPFFLYLAYNAPHWPLQAPEELVQEYMPVYEMGWDIMREQRFARQKELGLFPADAVLPPRDEQMASWEEALRSSAWMEEILNPPWEKEKKEYPEFENPEGNKADWVRRMAVYAAVMDLVDQNIGKLVTHLEKRGTLEKTIFIFLSDNGGCPEGQRSTNYYGNIGYPWACASNTPLRKYKSRLQEGGMRTPFIITWPGHFPAGAINHGQVAQTKDIMATLLAITGAEYPSERAGVAIKPQESRSFLTACADPQKADNAEAYFWEHAGNCAVRVGDWKALYDTGWVPQDRFVEKRWYLYNLASDPFEARDCATEHPEVLADLVARYLAWAERVDCTNRPKL